MKVTKTRLRKAGALGTSKIGKNLKDSQEFRCASLKNLRLLIFLGPRGEGGGPGGLTPALEKFKKNGDLMSKLS